MSERDIDAQIEALREAIANNDEAAAQLVALRLLGGFLKNIGRIGAAADTIARTINHNRTAGPA